MYKDKKSKYVTFIVTHQCQLRCSYCYEHCKSDKVMSFEVAKKCVDLLFEEDAKNSRYINEENANGIILDFIGGEPLLEIKLIDKIVDYFLEKAVLLNHRWAIRHIITMSSNGVAFFDPDVIAFMDKHNGRVQIGITVDGNKELHDSCRKFPNGEGSYDLAAAAFRAAKDRFKQSGTKMTIARANLPYLFVACKDIITNFDLKELWGNCVFEEDWNVEDARLYYQQLKMLADWLIDTGRWKETSVSFFDDFIGHPLPENENQNYCGGAGDMLAFDVDGTCYPCLRYAPLSMPKELADKFIIGHCDTGLEATECQHDCVNCLNGVTRRSQSTDECWNCPIASGCAWCSAYNAEFSNGNVDKRCTNICIMHHARVLASRYFYGKTAAICGEPNIFQLNVPEDKGVEIVGKEEFEVLKSMN